MELTYKAYNKEQLLDYVNDEKFKTSKHIAISHHRAVSQLHNPRCRSEDIIMLMVWEKDNLVAYLGILPDELYLDSSVQIHIGWLSCLWVNPDYRGMGIAGKLLNMALKAYDNQIILTEYTPEAGKLYEKSGLFVLAKKLVGTRYYFRSCLADILPPKHRLFKQIKPLLKLSDQTFNLIFDFRFRNNSLPEKTDQFIRVFDFQELNDKKSNLRCKKSIFRRTLKEFDWILKYPWLTPSDHNYNYKDRYHFSAVDSTFENLFYLHRSKANDFIWFTLRKRHLKLVYHHTDIIEKEFFEKIISSGKIDIFSCYDPSINRSVEYLQQKALFTKKIFRNYMISKELNQKITNSGNISIEDGDGDCAFT